MNEKFVFGRLATTCHLLLSIEHLPIAGEFRVMVINATFINISAISWR
jgi:hypothetical protein